jgi:hypothetical protein
LTHPVVAAEWWREEARRYRTIAEDASGAAIRSWDRGDERACEVAITLTEDALRWAEACAAFAEAHETLAWAAMADDCTAGLGDFAGATEAAHDARACVEAAREACRQAVAVRRLARLLPDCTGETLCAGTEAVAPVCP